MIKSASRVIVLTLLCGLGACTSAPRARTDDPLALGQTPVATPLPGAQPETPPETPSATQPATPTPTATDGGDGDGSSETEPDYPRDLAGYARAAVAAWAAGDRARLDDLEMAGGVLHRVPPTRGFALARCASGSCLFFNGRGDELRLPLRGTAVGRPRAVGAAGSLQPTTFPSDNRAYAGVALAAWQGRNDARLRMLTRQQLSCARVDAIGAPRTSTWTFHHGDGGVGSVYLTWRDRSAHGLTFRFENGPAAPTSGPTSEHRIIEILYEP